MTKYTVLFCIGFSVLAVWFDWRSFRIPNRLILAGYVSAFFVKMLWTNGTGTEKWSCLISGALCPIFLMGFVWIIGGIGAGDVKVLSVLGAVLGGKEILICCIMALLIGAFIGIVAIIRKRKKIHFSIAILVGILLYFIQSEILI